MSLDEYVLYIDCEPANQDLAEYFAQFKTRIVHQEKVTVATPTENLPAALLIHWSFIQQDINLLTRIFEAYPIPIVIINDYHDEEICIQALESGADDYITKPLHPREVHARIQAISRRVGVNGNAAVVGRYVLEFAHWTLYPASRQIFDAHERELILSAGEYDLLYLFLQKPQCVLDREYLLQTTKQRELNPLDRRIDVQISRLRQKIEPNPKNPSLLKTVRNGGYLFTAPVISRIKFYKDNRG